MWNVLRSQIKNYVAYLKKQREQMRGVIAPVLHIKRTRAEIQISGGLGQSHVFPARVILNDFTPQGVYLFTSIPFNVEEQISLTMEEPKRFYIRGRIVSCQALILDRRIISEEVYPYRTGIQFEFQSLEEAQAVQEYCEAIYAEIWKIA